ncbi:MAG: DUF2860 domain-containing protein, partial [Steroidobacteraceae bacterium]|nr:DUF2860 domain-containing protein [Steroidobacteraceae bacterium]
MSSSSGRLSLLAMLTVGTVPAASGIEPIPSTPGWRGFVVGGAGYVDLKSNVVAGNNLIDIGQPVISSVAQRPTSDDTFHPLVTGEINYTFGGGWQAFFGTSLEDAVTLDGVTQLGARKDLGSAGILQGGFLFSGIPTQVWEDPYAEGVRREETDRDSTGVRLQWDRVLGSAFELTFSYRDISIDTERSGQGVSSVACNAACQELLRRDGDQYHFDASYLFRLGEGRNHLVRPMLRYTIDDRDGDAISGDAYRLQLSYIFLGQGYSVASNVAFGSGSQDARNPVFGRKTDSDRFAIDATLFYRLPAESGRWQAVGSVTWGEEDSEV